MKPRRIVLTIETTTDTPLEVLRRLIQVIGRSRHGDESVLDVHQVQANVIQEPPEPRRGRKG